MSRPAHHRRGNALLMFLFLLAFMGVLALVVDLGFVYLTQRQMQTGVHASALEGLRFRDALPNLETLVALLDEPAPTTDLTDRDQVIADLETESGLSGAALVDYVRRKASQRMVHLVYDEDYNLETTNSGTTGIGPVFELSDPADLPHSNDGAVRQTINSVVAGLPDVQLNLANQVHGDLLAGVYNPNASHREASDYSRADFVPDSAAPDAFLVRLRRTRGLQDETQIGGEDRSFDDEPGISSSQRAVPLLFGRAAMIPAVDASAQHSYRRHGTTVRATGIAQAQPVVRVGPPFAGVRGVAPLTLERGFWQQLGSGDFSLWADADGQLHDADPSDPNATPMVVGRMIRATALAEPAGEGSTQIRVLAASGFPTDTPFQVIVGGWSPTVTAIDDGDATLWTIDPPLKAELSVGQSVVLRGLVHVGDDLTQPAPPFGVELPEVGYVPIYDTFDDVRRVVGFGWLETTGTTLPLPGEYPVELSFTRQTGRIAPENASSVPRNLPIGPTDDQLREIWSSHRTLDHSLLAPSLVRATR